VCVIPFALAQRTVSKRTLTFAERVAYQRAIEDVYWRHRIWPKENPDPKPSLDAVISQAQLEKKVEDYLLKSQTLEDHWQRPITAEQLQAEMDRMAQHTRQPEVLSELFAALGNDPFIIAECLARPALSSRLVTDLSVRNKDLLSRNAVAENHILSLIAVPSATYAVPYISEGAGCSDDTWTDTSIANAPEGRYLHTAVWTGSEMIVWGGDNTGGEGRNTGGRYNPSTDSWTATSTINAPFPRYRHTAVWTGSEMIVWGGHGHGGQTNSGGRYNPSSDTWAPTNGDAPEGRYYHTAVWTGSEMIIWGGYGNTGNLNTGGRYNPNTDTWTATSMTNAPSARADHTAVWSGSEMIVWGGYDSSYSNTGGRYNPNIDSWTATSITNAPSVRYAPTGVWTGSEMIVWGGYGPPCNPNCSALNTGGRYNPSTDGWTTTTTTFAPAPRYDHTAVWTASEMIIWGGLGPNLLLGSGGRYNPSNNSWTAISTTDAPTARFGHTAVWAGSEMIVWGGDAVTTPTARPQLADQPSITENTGGRYCAQLASPTPTPTASPTMTPTPTASPAGCSWSAGPDMPTPLVRAVGVYFPADGNFYTMGGRTSDTAGSDFQHVLRYTPSTNSWTQMGVTLPDNQINNMACGVLPVSGTSYIYCVGGSAAGQTTATARVFFYNPASDTVTTLSSEDNWPGDAAGTILPGGFAVASNKLYILGGFNINVASTNQIWEFDPTAAVGAKWLRRVNTPGGVMYAPTCARGGIVDLAGASDYQGGTVVDTTNSFSFDPITLYTSIPSNPTIPTNFSKP